MLLKQSSNVEKKFFRGVGAQEKSQLRWGATPERRGGEGGSMKKN